MKKVFGKKFIIIGSTILGVSAIGAGAAIASAKLLKHKGSSKQVSTAGKYAANKVELQSFVDKHTNEVIDITSLKKSLKMSLNLYRGGWFDISQTNIMGLSVSNQHKAEFSELISFIDNASIDQAISFNENFSKIKFLKNFAVSFKDAFEIKMRFKDVEDTTQWLDKTKTIVWNWGVDAIRGLALRHYSHGEVNDFSFFSHNDKDQNVFNDFVSDEDWNNYFRYSKSDGSLITFEEAKQMIQKANTADELKTTITNTLDEPVVCFNLDDRFLIKFKGVKNDSYAITNVVSNESHNIDVKLKGEWDPVFGTKDSWYQYAAFAGNYFQKNAISPMFLIDKQGTTVHDNNTDFYIQDNEIDAQSINYSMPQTYEQIMNYKSSVNQFNRGLIKLNESRYYENKLHEQQTPDHGFIPMSDVDMYNETMTGNWYPHIRQEYATMWQYVSKYIQWGWKTTWPTPLQVDTAHKNGAEFMGLDSMIRLLQWF